MTWSFTRACLVVASLALAGCVATSSLRMETLAPTGPRLSHDQARTQFIVALDSARVHRCAPEDGGYQRFESAQFDGGSAVLSCSDNRRRTIVFRDLPNLYTSPAYGPQVVCAGPNVEACFDRNGLTQRDAVAFVLERRDVQPFVNAWAVLAGPASSPLEDTAFQAAVARERASGRDFTEPQRRAQLQAEALVEGRREADAANVYRTALEQMPHWSLGHYNLALIEASLSHYAAAVSAMQRYLYLEPNAPDARAVQDQIYRWEALRNTSN
ncbi:hypothetical protein U91I_03734 [alpha proteobacterium U9-1i]|nr:hypothetical protein U91I_03734 [alpha proteobacterium U9-1i]